MSHGTLTFTVTCAFWVEGQAKATEPPAHGWLADQAKHYVEDGLLPTRALEAAHDLMVGATANWAGKMLERLADVDPLAEAVGFTACKSWGGGAGWEKERGVVLTFSGLSSAHRPLMITVATGLKLREGQEAVVLNERVEKFSLL
jgi:hypothetical protein